MPIYEYTCGACKAEFELLVSLSGKGKPRCSACGSAKISKKFSLFGARAKGGNGGSGGGAHSSCAGCSSGKCSSCKR